MKVSMSRGVCINMLLLFWISVFCCFTSTEATESNDTVAVDIGIVYAEDDELGKMGYNCIQTALSEFYKSHGHYKTRITLHTHLYHQYNSVVGAASSALYLLKYSKVKAMVGPTTSTDAEFILHLGQRAQVPVISYSPTSPPCLSTGQCSYFINAAQNDIVQVEAIAALIKAFQWRYVIPIYEENNGYGAGLIPSLDDALQKINARIPFHEAISSTATDGQIYQLLKNLKRMQTRVFVVHMSSELASRLFLIANNLEMMSQGYVWLVTTSISNELASFDNRVIESMQGVVGVQTNVPDTNELKRFKSRWEREFLDIKLNVMGLWAYDTACALARAAEDVITPNSSFKYAKMSGTLTDLDTFGVSSVGPQLLKGLYNTNFTGLSGNFSLAKGQRGSLSTYRIVNVFSNVNQGVGFWTSEKGFVQNLNFKGKNSGLRPIIWPGDKTSPPKGWEIPASGNMLRVGVPVKRVYKQLVNVTLNSTNVSDSVNVTGFCIDIFDTIMKNLGYSHHYKYFAFVKPDGSSPYDELVQQVYLQKYDVVVGDITIIANRTKYVDFSLPFTESGVTMVVPVRDDKQSAWAFLKPLTWELWMATVGSFIFIAFVIWVLEHRINDDFRGPPLHQAGTSLFYSFSMMVFAQRENVYNNLSRCVVVVWVFVVLVLSQSYTASLTSILTVQQLKPTITDIDELLNTGAFIGVQEGSFVKDLMRQKGFHESKIISYGTLKDLDELLHRDSGKGGIAAVFDEIPYMQLFLAQYPSKYVMMQPLYKTDGFGFGFQKGSPLVSEVSEEILRVTEGKMMSELEKKWVMQLSNTLDMGNNPISTRLTLDSFWGLFLMVGVSTGICLLVFLAEFLYKHKKIWMNSNASVWSRTHTLANVFKDRDMDAHTFRKKDMQTTQNVETDQTSIDSDGPDVNPPTASSTPPRPSNYSDNIEESLRSSAQCIPNKE